MEWNTAGSWDGDGHGWPRWIKRLSPDRSLYARDVGLDRANMESLCKLLNELREEAVAHR